MMTRRTMAVLCGAAAMAVLTTACSHSSATPPPTSANNTSTSATSSGLPHSGAPKVEHPLPASVVSGTPCDGLTSQQLTQILTTVPPTRPNTDAAGPSCTWINSDKNSLVSLAYDTQDHTGLSGFYENTKPQATVWKPLPDIQGFPAVAHVTPSGGSPTDFCQVSIGIADDISVDVSIGLSDAKKGKADPCEVTAQVSDMVVTNLRQKAGS
ncbi:MAG: hypothetical protein JWQ81_8477 [Amycolatopsis sp.]|uniref:DUF3558 domain-containing protein n=1 Tax=Amycolatopsis sp. TaxID=37632 RepID=UPI00261B5E6F|nr:DUF3558 domain-containing protein [Amycolatopsis sp.]MCU1687738.1 hypothetical protein [Amycolatopsis sp.]